MERRLVHLGDQLGRGFISRREFLRRAVILTGSAAAASAALAACSSPTPGVAPASAPAASGRPAGAPKLGGTLISARTADTAGLDPQLDGLLARVRISPLMYSNVVKLGFDLSIQPDLAESWEVKDDGKTIVFKLRQGVTWHPPINREFVADDVKYSYGRLLKESAGKGLFASIKDIEAVDKYTVAFHLTEANGGLLASMADPQWGHIVNREAIETYGDLHKKAVGTGPFILEEWIPDQETRLRKNPNYFVKGRPYIDRLVLRIIPEESAIVAALRTDNVHHAMLEDNKNFDLLKNERNLTSYRSTRLGFDHMVINHKAPPFDKQQVREALSWAIDREEIIKAATQGYGQLTAPLTAALKPWQLPKDAWTPFYKPDPERAKKLLAEAGLPNGFKTTLTLMPTFPTMVASAPVIQSNLKRVGIDVEIQAVESGAMLKRWLAKDFSLNMNLTGGGADPDGVLGRMFYSKGENWPNWQASDIDKLLDEGRGTFDVAKRKAAYDQVQLQLLQRAALIWTFAGEQIDFTQGYLKGFQQHPKTSLSSFDEMWLDKP